MARLARIVVPTEPVRLPAPRGVEYACPPVPGTVPKVGALYVLSIAAVVQVL